MKQESKGAPVLGSLGKFGSPRKPSSSGVLFAKLLREGERVAFQPILCALCCINCLITELIDGSTGSLGTNNLGAERRNLQGFAFEAHYALEETPDD